MLTPRVLLYHNLKSAVRERRGDAIHFHPTRMDLSVHYHFEPRPVAVARGNEKGGVERAICYIRAAFFAARYPKLGFVYGEHPSCALWCREIAGDGQKPGSSVELW